MLTVPSLSIALRAVFEYNQALYYTFVALLIYVYALYSYIKYIKTGLLPKSIQTILDKATNQVAKEASKKEEKTILEKGSRSLLYKAISGIRAKPVVPELKGPGTGIDKNIAGKTKLFNRIIPYKFFSRFKSITATAILYNFGKIALVAGLALVMSGIIGFFMNIPVFNQENYFEFASVGLIMLVLGVSLLVRKHIPPSRNTIIIYLLGIFMSGAGVLLFQILTLEEFKSDLSLVLLLYSGGLGLLIINILLARRKRELKQAD